MSINIDAIKTYFLMLQDAICDAIAVEESNGQFIEDAWQRAEGGGGRTRVLSGGEVIEQAGINFSHVTGNKLPPSATTQRPELAGCQFQALGVSGIVHPRNPYAPTTHINVRFFIAKKTKKSISLQLPQLKGEEYIWWFGGGFDLSPYYGFIEDCVHWHKTAKQICDPFGESIYADYKKKCDDYFYLKHRQEPRGIGGIFFDDLNEWGFERCFEFIKNVGEGFIAAYIPLLQRRKDTLYGERERDFQCYRRGRYVEFNLVYDRGTLFGLQSGGRTESILVSLPPAVTWRYNWRPDSNTAEAELYEKFLTPRDWV